MQRLVICALSTTLVLAFTATAAYAQDTKLTIDPTGAVTTRLGYIPIRLAVSPTKPAQVKKEPVYSATPQYGIIKMGNGPKSEYVFALDEPTNADFKIYIDKNRNGDLTDDGDGSWNKKDESNGRVMYGVMNVTLRASYGDRKKETASADYVIGLYRFAGTPSPLMYRQSARVGQVAIDGKNHKVLLVENDTDGVFSKPITKVDEAGKTMPVWLLIDLKDDGKMVGPIDIRAPFMLGGKAYEATVSADGAKFKMAPTTKPVLDLSPKEPPTPPLLKAGTSAPDFTALKWGGGNIKLSDYRGKIVVLDFWATWCPPCRASMPHLQQVFEAVQNQDVVVLALCVSDTKASYDKWVPENEGKLKFQFAFDPAGQDRSKSISANLFKVSGIPTTYIIDKDGKVAASIVGYDTGDTRVEEALKRLGVKID